ncbi:hypothetical protein RCL1_003009 [Eukaryota sp. TZLM3-RCL]
MELSAAFVVFDLREGPKVLFSYPESLPIHDSLISDIALPDGLHNKLKESCFTIYNDFCITSSCLTVVDPLLPRGAKTSALVLISKSIFPVFLNILSAFLLQLVPEDISNGINFLRDSISSIQEAFTNNLTGFTLYNRFFVLPTINSTCIPQPGVSGSILSLGPKILSFLIALILDNDRNSKRVCFYSTFSSFLSNTTHCIGILFATLNIKCFPFLPLSLIDDVIFDNSDLFFGSSNQIVFNRRDVDLFVSISPEEAPKFKLGNVRINYKPFMKISNEIFNYSNQGHCDSSIINYFKSKINSVQNLSSNIPVSFIEYSNLYSDLSDSIPVKIYFFKTLTLKILKFRQNFHSKIEAHWFKILSDEPLSIELNNEDEACFLYFIKSINPLDLSLPIFQSYISFLNSLWPTALLDVLDCFSEIIFECFLAKFSIDASSLSLKLSLLKLFSNFYSSVLRHSFISGIVSPVSINFYKKTLNCAASLLSFSAELTTLTLILEHFSLLLMLNQMSRHDFLTQEDLSMMKSSCLSLTVPVNSTAWTCYVWICDYFNVSLPLSTRLPSPVTIALRTTKNSPSVVAMHDLSVFLSACSVDLFHVLEISNTILPCCHPSYGPLSLKALKLLKLCCFFRSTICSLANNLNELVFSTVLHVNLTPNVSNFQKNWFQIVFEIYLIMFSVDPITVRPFLTKLLPFIQQKDIIPLSRVLNTLFDK